MVTVPSTKVCLDLFDRESLVAVRLVSAHLLIQFTTPIKRDLIGKTKTTSVRITVAKPLALNWWESSKGRWGPLVPGTDRPGA